MNLPVSSHLHLSEAVPTVDTFFCDIQISSPATKQRSLYLAGETKCRPMLIGKQNCCGITHRLAI